ncbi:hybrid sensor histidine kinase/response regulator [Geomonas azotofigens]|uniref:hybrid sensor histidine kinase/response regulator n=1 Tax=Geomonas azotofigens TaxID=2843196 RepID=UPI001C1139D8|nr:response regulator [Geomonas azotofigens]MBU5614076.1 response regulator [Geomonas azotofigens]
MLDSDALLKELLATFEQEAREHLGELSSLLLALERDPEAAERGHLLESVFRRVHTLKGAAHAVNLPDVAFACQRLEDMLADLKRGDLALGLEQFDSLHVSINDLGQRLCFGSPAAEPAAFPAEAPPPIPAPLARTAPRETPESVAPPARQATEPVAVPGAAPRPARLPEGRAVQQRHAVARPQGDETVRVSARLLEELLLQSEELVSAKLSASALHEELAAAAGELALRQGEQGRALEVARRGAKDATGREAALCALLERGCHTERQVVGRLRLLEKSAEKHLRSLQSMLDPLLEEMKKLQLLPCATLCDPFAKVVRDLSRELGKEAEFTCLGGELEIDRRILAELKEPLLHLVRNTVDHGIEPPSVREAAGKPARGSIRIEIRLQDANRAELLLEDDGGGIDVARVKGAALRLEGVSAELLERMPDHEALQLIFEGGLSTKRSVGSVSGRGVGLAIVRDALERLGGHVSVSSTPGAGTAFRLVFPLSFARIRGLLVQVGGRDCVIPATNVELSARVAHDEVKRLENRDTLLVNGELVALVSLGRILEVKRGAAGMERTVCYVLLHAGDKRIAFAVDQVLGVQEILVKPLGRQLSRVRNVAGATVLGNGRVVPVLNVADLFRSALTIEAPAVPPPSPAVPARRVSVLVAEDSITSRTLLKNILESAGYEVRTAVDGADALAQLKAESCDVVVSDIEMPRMDGFQLTAAIRADSRLAALPVILVTGLESRADRERGIDVGASAYLVKSGFDQANLIEVIQKLS